MNRLLARRLGIFSLKLGLDKLPETVTYEILTDGTILLRLKNYQTKRGAITGNIIIKPHDKSRI